MALLEGYPRAEERLDDLDHDLGTDHASPHAQNVDAVVLDALVRGVMVVDRARADAADLAGGDRHAGARAADDDPPLGAAVGHRVPDLERLVGVVDRRGRAIGAEVEHLVTEVADLEQQPIAQRVTGVIESAGDDHDRTCTGASCDAPASSCAASSAAPNTPARTP